MVELSDIVGAPEKSDKMKLRMKMKVYTRIAQINGV